MPWRTSNIEMEFHNVTLLTQQLVYLKLSYPLNVVLFILTCYKSKCHQEFELTNYNSNVDNTTKYIWHSLTYWLPSLCMQLFILHSLLLLWMKQGVDLQYVQVDVRCWTHPTVYPLWFILLEMMISFHQYLPFTYFEVRYILCSNPMVCLCLTSWSLHVTHFHPRMEECIYYSEVYWGTCSAELSSLGIPVMHVLTLVQPFTFSSSLSPIEPLHFKE